MTDDQARTFEALARGRLIFPFRGELAELRAESKRGPLTSDEAARLKDLSAAFDKVKVKDQWFHSAMLAGDIEAAAKAAEEALAILEEVA